MILKKRQKSTEFATVPFLHNGDKMKKRYRAILENFLKQKGIKFFKEFSLKEFTYYKVGGNAEFAVFPETVKQLTLLKSFCYKNAIPFFVLGGGANIIVNDNGVEGVVCFTSELKKLSVKGNRVLAECGVFLDKLAVFAAEKGLSGFEFAYNIPGTVGGALVMNAGNNYGEFSRITCVVKACDYRGKIFNFPANLCKFGYRTSIFKTEKLIVLSAVFSCKKRDKKEIYALMEKIKEERERKFPLEFPNAGSVFKRPKGYYAGKLIEDAGCGGLKVGGAMVSPKHKGFIVNTGNATAEDIKNLIALVQERVYRKFGVKLEREQIYFPEDLT